MKGPLSKKLVGCKTKIRKCEKHGEYESKPYLFFNKPIYPGCPECIAADEEERKQLEGREARRAYASLLSSSGITKRFASATFDSYNPISDKAESIFKIVYSYYDRFEEIKKAGTCLIMCGRPGTGKTHLANALAISLINQKRYVYYTTSYKIMARIKATYGKFSQETEINVMKNLTEKDLLIIDEVGVQFGSEAEKVLFFQIINGRYENMLPTVLISNLTAQELSFFIGERCFDRLKENSGAVLSFDWKSYRKEKGKNHGDRN